MVRPIGSPTALGLYGLSTVRSCWRANSSTGWGPRSRNPLGSALEDRCGARLYHRVNPIRSRGDSPADRKRRLEDAAGIVGVVVFALAIYVAFAAELEDAPGPYGAAARAQNAGEPGRRRVAGGADDARTNEGVRQTLVPPASSGPATPLHLPSSKRLHLAKRTRAMCRRGEQG